MANIVSLSHTFRAILRTSIQRASIGKYSSKTPSVIDDAEYIKDDENAQSDIAAALHTDVDVEAAEAEIERKRNKSGLLPQDRRILNKQKPYDEPTSWIHTTVRYNRSLYGRYGEASGVDPRISFPTAEDRDERLEFENVAHPKTLKQMIEENKQRRIDEKEATAARERDVEIKFAKLTQWKNEFHAKIAKRESDAKAALEKKARLVEEIRRQFGFKMDSRDPRFKELVEKKEQEDKKLAKQAKKKQMEAKMLAKLIQSANADSVDVAKPKPDQQAAPQPDKSAEQQPTTEGTGTKKSKGEKKKKS